MTSSSWPGTRAETLPPVHTTRPQRKISACCLVRSSLISWICAWSSGDQFAGSCSGFFSGEPMSSFHFSCGLPRKGLKIFDCGAFHGKAGAPVCIKLVESRYVAFLGISGCERGVGKYLRVQILLQVLSRLALTARGVGGQNCHSPRAALTGSIRNRDRNI